MNQSKRLLIVIAVMAATLMQVIDITIVNVALPHMQGSLSTTPDAITWTLTSYLVSAAIMMPLTGYFTEFFGRKNYLLICIIGFTISSAFCGAAQTLAEIVCFRLLQGIFGAALVPLSQAILVDIYPVEERGKAMAIWGVGIMVGPILGPTLGGYLTEFLNWRFTFYLNVPVGILAVILVWNFIPHTEKIKRSIDWIGLLFLLFGIGCLQYFLDRGSQDDWFSALNIRIAFCGTITGLASFLLYNFWNKKNNAKQTLFDIRIFKDRNFTVSSLLLALLGLGLFGTLVIQPLLLENLLNYSVLITGLIMAPRGITSMVSMFIVGKIINHVSPRLLVALGVGITALGIYPCTFYSQNIDIWWIIVPMLVQGFGIGMIFVPLSVLAFETLPKNAQVEAAGVFSLLRTIGSSVGIAVTMTFLIRHGQIAWNNLAGFFNSYNPALYKYLASAHISIHSHIALGMLGSEISQQSQILAYVNVFSFITWGFLAMLPLVLLLKRKVNQP